MTKRCCVFVDGENFRHGIVNLLAKDFDKRDHLPKHANWGTFFDWLVNEVCPGSDRVRTYWYVIRDLDFFPHSFPPAVTGKKKLLEKGGWPRDRMSGKSGPQLLNECDSIIAELEHRKSIMNSRFAVWNSIHREIELKHKYIEFRRAGNIRYNLFDNQFGKEKAVDVKLAVDMIMLRSIYDVAIVVSGDQDYVPAVQAAKDAGKAVVNVAFERRDGKLHPGGAVRLNQLTDTSIRVPHGVLKKFLLPSPSSPTPPDTASSCPPARTAAPGSARTP